MIGYIYSLHRKNEDDVFYIGASFNPASRIISHRCTWPYWKFDCRIGLSIVEEVEVADFKELEKVEKYWIQQFVAWGFSLVNYNLMYGFDVRRLSMLSELEREMKDENYITNKYPHLFNREYILYCLECLAE